MKKIHQILQIILLVYFAGFLVFFISFNTLGGLVGMEEVTADNLVSILLVGLVLFLLAWLLSKMTVSSLEGKIKKMEQEMNGLKAKIYDFEHPKKETKSKPAPAQKSTPPSESSDQEQSSIPPRQNIIDE
ncbi:hypothetical protein [Algoriphagus sp. CAU 1675]|uniref:hypothetical protein n=1 Tax=Algoriphagus sp. CAU 1675 TaxID=3032597 RepID=UPI0023DA3868|nr:hypothetical protein [Algoriphagus sp. CAU 1675]MDF2157588.1 hypothetical protein [Algoriphagus sp. CAU 1675]